MFRDTLIAAAFVLSLTTPAPAGGMTQKEEVATLLLQGSLKQEHLSQYKLALVFDRSPIGIWVNVRKLPTSEADVDDAVLLDNLCSYIHLDNMNAPVLLTVEEMKFGEMVDERRYELDCSE